MNKKIMSQLVPKIVGIETEYALASRNGIATFQLPREFFEFTVKNPIAWDYRLESAARDARNPWIPSSGSSDTLMAQPLQDSLSQDVQANKIQAVISRDLSTVLPNGARFYIDHAHPEWSSPECLTAEDAALYDKAGERFLMSLVDTFNQSREPGSTIVLYKNNSDHQGHSYGCHENYLIDAKVYEDLFNSKAHQLYTYLLPYFITRQIFCGAGKVGTENGSGQVDYQLSQRADFFESIVGLQTTHHRPIINTRDEAHALSNRWRRLHVICGDSNLSAWSTYLKIGVTQIILSLLESQCVRLPSKIMLADPLAAIRAISQDPSLKVKIRLDGRRAKYTALDIQKVYLDISRKFLDKNAEAKLQWENVWQDWAQVIQWLEESNEVLDRRLDWRIKRKFLNSHIQRKKIGWDDPQAKELDIKYHALDEQQGIYFILSKNGLIDELFAHEQIRMAVSTPPSDTRAYMRGQLVKRYSDQISSMNWDAVSFANADALGDKSLRLDMTNPMMYNKHQVADFFNNNERDILKFLTKIHILHTIKAEDYYGTIS